MIEFEIQFQGNPIGSVFIGDSAHQKVQDLRSSYLQEEGAADAVAFPAVVDVGGEISVKFSVKGQPMMVTRALLEVSKDKVEFYLHVNGQKLKYEITEMFN